MSFSGHADHSLGIRRRLWSAFLSFLEIIGLRRATPPDFEARVAELKLRYFQLRDLLTANTDLLEIIAEMEMRLQGASYFSLRFVRAKTLEAMTCAHRMVTNYAALAGKPVAELNDALGRIQVELSASLAACEPLASDDWVIPLERIDRASAPLVGNKMANLGEIRNRVGLPVPGGFAVTVGAFNHVIEEAGGIELFRPPEKPAAGTDLEIFAQAARNRIEKTPIANEIADTIRRAYDAAVSGSRRVSVRSSALEEDTEISFAGQYLTVLNVGRQDLISAYRSVLASAYEPGAVFYRQSMGIDEADLGVAVGFMEMIESLVSGIAYSRDPEKPWSGDVLVHAVWGLGALIVSGEADPDVYVVKRGSLEPEVRVRIGWKKTRLRPGDDGIAEEPVPEELQRIASLSLEEARTIASVAIELEHHFGQPQDLEWAMDANRHLYVLQSRPAASLPAPSTREQDETAGGEIVLEGGTTAAHGVGAGPVFIATSGDELAALPDRAVLVATHSSPKFVRAMTKVSAIVTEVGSSIGHMASLCREFGVPTIVGIDGALSALPPGEIVTVDATRRRIYRGMITRLLASATGPAARPLLPRSAAPALRSVARHIVPLNLTDPRDPDFVPSHCRTLHDLARYVHEKSFQEMFGISELAGDYRTQAPMLDVFLPIDLYIIDLGGGLDAPPGAKKVKRNRILSAPFAAFVDGMLHPGIPRSGPRSMDARGFMHVVMHQALENPEWDESLRAPCYAIISERYLNVASRVGFHFSALDAYCGDSVNQNYVKFRFKGGAADSARRERRVLAIEQILKRLEFTTDVRGDLVAAQYVKQPREKILETLQLVGRLLQFMRQMDAAMTSDDMIERLVRDFFATPEGGEAASIASPPQSVS